MSSLLQSTPYGNGADASFSTVNIQHGTYLGCGFMLEQPMPTVSQQDCVVGITPVAMSAFTTIYQNQFSLNPDANDRVEFIVPLTGLYSIRAIATFTNEDTKAVVGGFGIVDAATDWVSQTAVNVPLPIGTTRLFGLSDEVMLVANNTYTFVCELVAGSGVATMNLDGLTLATSPPPRVSVQLRQIIQ